MRGLDGDRRLRDLYDVYAVLNARDLDFNLLQQTFLAAGAENQKKLEPRNASRLVLQCHFWPPSFTRRPRFHRPPAHLCRNKNNSLKLA